MKEYRAAILAGYFENEPQDPTMVQIYSAIKVRAKWTMYEELISRYKCLKYLLAVPVGPFVTGYFESLLKKHLDSIEGNESLQVAGVSKPADASVSPK